MTKIMTFLDFRNSGRKNRFFHEIGGRASVLVPETQQRRGRMTFYNFSSRLGGRMTKTLRFGLRQLFVFQLGNQDFQDLTITTFLRAVGALQIAVFSMYSTRIGFRGSVLSIYRAATKFPAPMSRIRLSKLKFSIFFSLKKLKSMNLGHCNIENLKISNFVFSLLVSQKPVSGE